MPTRGFPPRARNNTPYVRLRAVARSHGRTQEDIAARLGITPKTLSKWETGTTAIPARHLVRFCEAYGIEVSDLVFGVAIDGAADDDEPELPKAAGL